MFADALASMVFLVTLDGEQHRASLKPSDVVRFERKFGRSISDLARGADGQPIDPELAEARPDLVKADLKIEELLFLAFCSLRRQGVVEGSFDDGFEAFLDRVDDLDFGEPEAPPTPGGDL